MQTRPEAAGGPGAGSAVPDGGYGWVVVGSAFLAHVVAFGLVYSFTVFFPPILEEFGTGRGAVAWVVSIASGLMLGIGAITGRLADRFGPTPVMLAGAILLTSGLLLTAAAGSITQIYFAYGLAVGLGVSAQFIPAVASVGQWFDRRRGVALGIAVAGTGIGALILAPLSERLIDAHGWRDAMRILAYGGGGALVLGALVIRGRGHGRRIGTVRDIIAGSRNFKLLYVSSIVASYGYWVPFVHMVPYATDRGLSKAAAASVVAVLGVGNTAGRIVMGAVADRIGRLRVLQISTIAMTLAMFGLPAVGSLPGFMAFAVVYGVFAGSFIAILPALTGDYFGVERLAGVTGLMFTGAGIGTLLGAPVTGILFDALGNYTVALIVAALALAAGSALLMPLEQPAAAKAR